MNGLSGSLYSGRLTGLRQQTGPSDDLDIFGASARPATSGRSGATYRGSLTGGLPRVTSQENAFGSLKREGSGRDSFSRLGTRAGLQDANAFNSSQPSSSDVAAQNASIANLNSLASNYNDALVGVQGSRFSGSNRVEDTPFYSAYNSYISALQNAELPESASPEIRAFQNDLLQYGGPLQTYTNPGTRSYLPKTGFTPGYLSSLVTSGVVDPGWQYVGPQQVNNQINSNPITLSQYGVIGQDHPQAYDSSFTTGALVNFDDRFYADFYNPWSGTVQNLYGNNVDTGHGYSYTPLLPDAPYVMQGYGGRFSHGPSGGPASYSPIDPQKEVLPYPDVQALPEDVVSRSLQQGSREAFGKNPTYDPVNVSGGTPDAPDLSQFPQAVSYQNSSGSGAVIGTNNRGAQVQISPRDVLSTKSVGSGYASLVNIRDSSGRVVRQEWISVSGPSNQTASGYYGGIVDSPLETSPLVTYASQGLTGPYSVGTGRIGQATRLTGNEIGTPRASDLLFRH